MGNSLNPIIDSYAKGKISAIHFNMDSETISIAIRDKNSTENTEIVFEDVKAFYYIDHDTHSELKLSDEALNAIAYDDFGFGEFSAAAEDEDDLFVTIPNFALNLEASSLFIDAHKIRINNQAYNVKF
ncbi:MAG: hypothetical protein PWP51_2538 [Clostridiales bacterium]|jgi:hypothetical protein|nr:hypothetical protein [Clostridiales bacterium]